MKIRPSLKHGDLVKYHKRCKNDPLFKNFGDLFVVLRLNGRSNKETYAFNSVENKFFSASCDGFCLVRVFNLRTGLTETLDRKQLWKTGANWKDYRLHLKQRKETCKF